MRSKHNSVPGLAVIMVGERRDSAKYVSMKQVRMRKRIGQAQHKTCRCCRDSEFSLVTLGATPISPTKRAPTKRKKRPND